MSRKTLPNSPSEKAEETSKCTQTAARVSPAHKREIVRLTCLFLGDTEKYPLHLFAPVTQKFLTEVRPLIEQLDAIKAKNQKP